MIAGGRQRRPDLVRRLDLQREDALAEQIALEEEVSVTMMRRAPEVVAPPKVEIKRRESLTTPNLLEMANQ